MVNMAVQWRGPNSSLATLAKELNARFGNPTRFYEYVTGYKSANNVTSHNADNNGIGHAMDIFVGAGHNISVAQGIDLAERLRLEGKKGSIPGHPDRLAYIIHRGRIAGDHTNWEWVAYNGIADHYDHIHISSVFDYFWGDSVAGHPLDYNSTAAWNLWVTSSQGSDITPIIDILENPLGIPKENLLQIVKAMQSTEFGTFLQKTLMNATAPSADGKNWTLASHLKGTSVRTVQLVKDVASVRGDIAGLKNQIAQLSKGTGVQIDTAQVTAAAKEGATAALAEAQATDAQLIAEAVLNEAAARLTGGSE